MFESPRLSLLTLSLAASLLSACSALPSPAETRAHQDALLRRSEARVYPVTGNSLAALDAARRPGALSLARRRAFKLADSVETAREPELLWRLSRAEADQVLLLKRAGAPRDQRDQAAANSLAFARRARELATAPSPALLGQLAAALGTTIHLRAMFDRATAAEETLEAIEAALAGDPGQLTALATLSTLRLRLATLPWIAKIFASGAPEGSVTDAILHAARCLKRQPSIAHALLLTRALTAEPQASAAAAQLERARATLRAALAEPNRAPRDAVLRPDAEAALKALDTP